MGTQLVLIGVWFAFGLASSSQPAPEPTKDKTNLPAVEQVVVTAQTPIVSTPQTRCNARAWQRLVGRTVGDLLTVGLPEGTRIYRLDDPPFTQKTANRLQIELNRSTRVRRVYCS